MKLPLILLLVILTSSAYAQDFLQETEASQFYDGFRQLVMENKREKVSKLLSYPLPAGGITLESPKDFLANYDKIMKGPILELIMCSSGKNVKKWAGEVIWFQMAAFGWMASISVIFIQ